jgi:hypothetical protein
MIFLLYLFGLIYLVGAIWTCYYGWEDGIWWFLLMLICQIGIPIWWILKFMGDRREFQYLKYPAMLYWGGLTGCIVCQVLLA